MKRPLLIAIIIVALIGGVFAYARLRPRASTAQRADPALAIAVAIGALERSDEFQLTAEQTKAILPLLRVLRDTDPNEVEVSRALAEAIREELTPDQLAELDRVRQEAASRRAQAQGGQGQRRRAPGQFGSGGPGFGPGGLGVAPGAGSARTGANAAARAQIRQRLLSRLIERLEQRL